ncbi:MAG: hypothetical protein SFV15_15445 [Polyangiaceae bacterium]|nr:hypothetical protein [Polyangiaceae bacterium]
METSTQVGLGVLLALGISLPALLGATSGQKDLQVTVPASLPFGTAGSLTQIEPSGLGVSLYPHGATQDQKFLGLMNTGLSLTTWQMNYGPTYQREVTWPVLVGPSYKADDFVCGYSVSMGAGLFETAGAGSGIANAVERMVKSKIHGRLQTEESGCIIDVPYPEVERVSTTIDFEEGFARVGITIWSGGTPWLWLSAALEMEEREGAIQIHLRPGEVPVVHLFDGDFKNQILAQAEQCGAGQGGFWGLAVGALMGPVGAALGGLAGADLGANAGSGTATQKIPLETQKKVNDTLYGALADLSRTLSGMTRPIYPLQARPNDAFEIRLSDAPKVSPTGLSFPMCLRIAPAARTHGAGSPSSSYFPGLAPAETVTTGDAAITLSLNANATSQILHYVWDTGFLSEWGKSAFVFDALSDRLKIAAFTFDGVDPMLPPTLAASSSAGSPLSMALGAVKLGSMDTRTVWGHAKLNMDVNQKADILELTGKVSDLHVNCASKVGETQVLSPCLGDLLPIAAQFAQRKGAAYSFNGSQVLKALPELTYGGLDLKLSHLQVSVTGSPPVLAIRTQGATE